MESSQPVEDFLSERIKAARKALGLSRVKAAKTWSISAATIQTTSKRQKET
jgi:DNA-binding transcriptional regulator YiaG